MGPQFKYQKKLQRHLHLLFDIFTPKSRELSMTYIKSIKDYFLSVV